MEELRRKLAMTGVADPINPHHIKKALTPKTVPRTVIDISSAESSPITSTVSSHSIASEPQQKEPSTIVEIADSSDDEDEGPIARAKQSNFKKRLVWSDDEDDQNVQLAARPASSPSGIAPTPELFAESNQTIYKKITPSFPLPAKETNTQKQPLLKPLPTIAASQVQEKKSGPTWDIFDPAIDNLYDPAQSAREAEQSLQDLLSESMNHDSVDVDMRLAEVDGFNEGIKLLPHQVAGRVWMAKRERTGRGGILADDMGLGKTIQTLTRIIDGRPRKKDKDDGYDASTLVVCPVALVSQWASEVRKMTAGLRVIEHHGQSRTINPDSLRRAHIIVTSYNILASEHAAYVQRMTGSIKSKSKKKGKSAPSTSDSESDSDSDEVIGRSVQKKKKIMDALFHLKWWRIVLDEAHNIKNRKTKAAIACCALEGKYRWALTGTPLQNNVEELYSLLKFLRIKPLDDWEIFNAQINQPVKAGKSKRAMKRLQVVLKVVMLRRKKDILELPERIVEIVPCEFDEEEREFYNSIESKVDGTINKLRQMGDVSKNYTSMLVLLLRLRQACNHPSLLSKDFLDDKEAVDPKAAKNDQGVDDADDLAELFGQMGVSSSRKCQVCQVTLSSENSASEAKYCNDCDKIARRKSINPSTTLPQDSAKIRKILKILEDIEERSGGAEKTIIFSQFTSMLDVVQPFLRHKGFKFVRYDGSMRKDKREESLQKIREDKSIKIILISFKAGSTGLNLTVCNNVILVDMWWNPALEDQAFDRAHRFGQTRNVNIHKLTIEDTVEQRILALQEKKRTLAAAALSGDRVARLGADELLNLFKHGVRDDDDDDD